jgi:FkbM family methyltransferase
LDFSRIGRIDSYYTSLSETPAHPWKNTRLSFNWPLQLLGQYELGVIITGSGSPSVKETIRRLSCSPVARKCYAAASKLPILGPPLRAFIRSVLPYETRVWIRIRAGLGKGLWAHLDPRFETVYVEGKYEHPLQESLSKHLQAGDVLYDVGAHIGIVSLCAARLVGPTGSVFAFEADPENAKRIEENVRRNRLEWITTARRAAWHCDGYVGFQRASEHSSRNQGGVTTLSPGGNNDAIEVEAITLDTFAERHRLPTVIKIDVEGAEAEVLRGSEKVFARAKPILICEVHGRRVADEVTRWLSDRGYRYRWLEPSPQFPRHILAESTLQSRIS